MKAIRLLFICFSLLFLSVSVYSEVELSRVEQVVLKKRTADDGLKNEVPSPLNPDVFIYDDSQIAICPDVRQEEAKVSVTVTDNETGQEIYNASEELMGNVTVWVPLCNANDGEYQLTITNGETILEGTFIIGENQ